MNDLIKYDDFRPTVRQDEPRQGGPIEVRYVYVQPVAESPPPAAGKTPWGWIISGTLLGLFMLLSFGQWAVSEIIKANEKSSERSFQLAREAMVYANQATETAGRTVEAASSSYGAAVLAVVFVIGVLCFLRGLMK